MGVFVENFKLAYSKIHNVLISVLSALIIGTIMFIFTDYATTSGNMGSFHANTEVVLQVLIAIVFGININLLVTKLEIASLSKKAAGSTTLGAILSVIISGCPACSITIASYLGLASFFAALPFSGIEVKILGFALLLWSSYDLLKKLSVCESKK